MKKMIFISDPEEFINELLLRMRKQSEDSSKRSTSKDSEELLTRKETATILKINLTTLWHWQKKGKLPTYSIGNRIYFKRSDIEKALIKIN
jgi:excisionase family DNA binding protein